MPRRTFYDTACPEQEHKLRMDGVVLQFGRDGLLSDPTEEQVAVMEADPYRRQRFVEGQLPRSTPKQIKAVEKPASGVAAIPPAPLAGESTSSEAEPTKDAETK